MVYWLNLYNAEQKNTVKKRIYIQSEIALIGNIILNLEYFPKFGGLFWKTLEPENKSNWGL